MQALMRTARRVVSSSTSILLLGETGVGKEWMARAIHQEGPRRDAPFVAVNCAALPESLLETELFGHERGAFTGAVRSRRGHFELAHQGTLFLDEIGEMPVHLQAKLLRALQERTIQRVGGEQPIDVDVRIMAATNRDPAAELAAGRLREDVYYRLAVVSLRVPPLRERREDLPALATTYAERFARSLRREVRGIAADAMDALLAYAWPGNLRELINVVERATLLAAGTEITRADLPEEIGRAGVDVVPMPAAVAAVRGGERGYAEARRAVLRDFERAYLADLLRAAGGRVGEAAARAGLNPRTLNALMRRHGLHKEDFKYVRPAASSPST
jgi:DNA-binding NtrC family response regulator